MQEEDGCKVGMKIPKIKNQRIIVLNHSKSEEWKEFSCGRQRNSEACTQCRLRFKCFSLRDEVLEVVTKELGCADIHKVNVKIMADFLFDKEIKVVEIPTVRKYKAGYEIRRERRLTPDNEIINIKSAYTDTGDYIGSPKFAYRLCKIRGITPEKIDSSHNVCSIGFSIINQKWYGWSHRAIFGFGVGDTVEEGDCTASSGWTDEYLKSHPEENTALPIGFTAKTLDNAKTMAIAFAKSVG